MLGFQEFALCPMSSSTPTTSTPSKCPIYSHQPTASAPIKMFSENGILNYYLCFISIVIYIYIYLVYYLYIYNRWSIWRVLTKLKCHCGIAADPFPSRRALRANGHQKQGQRPHGKTLAAKTEDFGALFSWHQSMPIKLVVQMQFQGPKISKFINWQCVKTLYPPVVHIKIAGIYGCSSP